MNKQKPIICPSCKGSGKIMERPDGISFKECRCVCHLNKILIRQPGFAWGEIKCIHCDENHKGQAI